MKNQILKIAGVKNEKEFYRKFPTEEAFMAKHGAKLTKAQDGFMGAPFKGMPSSKFNVSPNSGFNTNVSQNPYMSGSLIGGQQMQKSYISSPNTSNFGSKMKTLGSNIGEGVKKAIAIPDLSTPSGLAGMIGGIGAGINTIKQTDKNIEELEKYGKVSDVVLQATKNKGEPIRNIYDRPEKYLVQNMNPKGTGTNYLAAENGAEIANYYTSPNTIYTDGGFEPLNDSNVKQYKKGGKLKKADPGAIISAANSLADVSRASGQLGGGLGSQWGGAGGETGGYTQMLGGFGLVGGLIGGLLDAPQLKRKQQAQSYLDENTGLISGTNQLDNFTQQNSGFMENGGWVSNDWMPQTITKFGEYNMKELLAPPHDADMLRAGGHLKEYTPPSERAMSTERAEYGMQMAMGGDLQVHRGEAETISYNPFLPNNGETVMFRGPSHDNGGMPISYGQNGVEVEGGEPAMVMKDGGEQDNLVVFGNMRIPDYGANEIGDKKAKGMKFKRYIADLSKQEAKNNKTMDKSFDLINSSNTDDPFDQLSFNSGQAMLMGSQMQLKSIADKKLSTSAVQNAILDTADEYGLNSAKLAEKNIAKFGGKFSTADVGTSLSSKTPVGRVIDDLYERFRPKTNPNFKGWDQIEKEQKPASKPAAPARAAAPVSTAKPLVPAATKPATATKSNTKASNQSAPKQSVDITSVNDFIKNIPFAERKAMAKVMGVPNFKGTTEQNEFLLKKTQQSDYAPLDDIRQPGYATSNTLQPVSAMNKSISAGDFGHDLNSIDGEDSEMSWDALGQTALSAIYPFIRPTAARPLDPNQLAPEMLASAMNQQEPVRAQLYNPMLTQATSISLQDQLNEVTAQTRDAMRMAQGDPSALSMIASQAEQAKSKILGEQFRMNQAEKQRVSEQNAAVLNDAQMKNLAILDQQYVRQATGTSKTKEQSIAIAKSIADKIAQNKLENRQQRTMENMYPAFNFTQEGIAYKNPLYLAGFGPGMGSSKSEGKLAQGLAYTYDENRNIIGTRKLKSDDNGKNGTIVKAIKNL